MMQANSDALSYSQEAARCYHLNTTYFKRSDKGQHRTPLRFWYREYLWKITKWYRQFLQSYRVHKTARSWASLKVQKGHTKVNVELVWDFYVENIHVKLHDIGNLWKVMFTRSSQMMIAWKFINVTQRSRSNLVEIIMSRTSLPVPLQHDAGKFWCFIIFTRSCKMLPFEHDLFQKVKKGRQRLNIELVRDFNVENISVKLQNDTGNPCRVIVFTMQHDLELVGRFKRSQKGQCRTRPRFLCREHPCKVTTWYREYMKSYHVHKVPDAARL